MRVNDNSIYKLSPKEIILNTVLPYELMDEVEQLKLGRYYDGVRPEWVWNEVEVNKCSNETLWRIIAISNTVWMEQQERIKSIYMKKHFQILNGGTIRDNGI